MAAIYKHSFDEKAIGRYLIGSRILDNGVIYLNDKAEIKSYFSAVGKGILKKYDGSNCIYVRIDPYQAQLLKTQVNYYKMFREF
jgi:hypothetical protein